jgi:hypothetical protein
MALTTADAGKKVSCKIHKKYIVTKGEIGFKDGTFFILQNIHSGFNRYTQNTGYDYSWSVNDGSDAKIAHNDITELVFLNQIHEVW